jgi:hypothetical protein
VKVCSPLVPADSVLLRTVLVTCVTRAGHPVLALPSYKMRRLDHRGDQCGRFPRRARDAEGPGSFGLLTRPARSMLGMTVVTAKLLLHVAAGFPDRSRRENSPSQSSLRQAGRLDAQ